MRRPNGLRWLVLAIGLSATAGTTADIHLEMPVSRLERISAAITELDLVRAGRLIALEDSQSPAILLEQARLAIYRGDCDRAALILAAPGFSESREAGALGQTAKSCAGATVAGIVIEDEARGIWLRVQDAGDRALAPLFFEVAAAARDAFAAELGVDLPRPLRIDLVRDLFSLSAVSGLPVTAAETTGTFALARFGRVIMLSPRATELGYPWQDTLAHEIVHLLVTRATRDYAPLWLQEGLAKRYETRWRKPAPYDRAEWADETARSAAREGRSIGVDKLGPSIAMLPTAEDAGTAYAEVTSFVNYWIELNGPAALWLLFADLRGVGERDPNAALRSVSGWELREWSARWQKALLQSPLVLAESSRGQHFPRSESGELVRRVWLSDLLAERGHGQAAYGELAPVVKNHPREPSLRFRAARARLMAGDRAASEHELGTASEIDGVFGRWQGLRGRFHQEAGDFAAAEEAFALGLAVDPLSEEVACEGFTVRIERHLGGAAAVSLPSLPDRRALCEAARLIPRD